MALPPFANPHSTSRQAWSPSSPASEDTEVTLPTASEMQDEDQLNEELERHGEVRFISYRTAAKLRSLQKQTYLHHVDIWNMIEAFRENGLHGLDPSAKLTESRVQKFINSLYDNLQKRLPPPLSTASTAANSSSSSSSLLPTSNQHHGILQTKANLLHSFLWKALTPSADRIKVRTLKTALASLCTGKLMDKFRYLFSQLADSEGLLIHSRFQHFMKDIMKLPIALGEYTTFLDVSDEMIFETEQEVTLNDFLETMMSDPGPQCLAWLPVLHRLVNAESVYHPVSCGNCLANGFHGLRYKSDRANYHLCQNCFWRGKISPPHSGDVFKEYNSFKTHSGKSSFKKSLHCIPSEKRASSKPHIPHFPEQTETPIDLSNLVPAVGSSQSARSHSSICSKQQPQQHSDSFLNFSASSDEHSLIAQYANQLASSYSGAESYNRRESGTSPGRTALNHSRQIVHDLEKRNREIMRDISQLRRYRDMDFQQDGCDNPQLVTELNHLRNHKDELDDRLSELQNTRKELMVELEELMKLLQGQKLSTSPNNAATAAFVRDGASSGMRQFSTGMDENRYHH